MSNCVQFHFIYESQFNHIFTEKLSQILIFPHTVSFSDKFVVHIHT
ncbi:MAG: hypothetical protein ACOZBL_02760 [Patescibacteria group bacterium]